MSGNQGNDVVYGRDGSDHAGHLLLWMTLLAIPQAGLIVLFYMHFRQLWREDD